MLAQRASALPAGGRATGARACFKPVRRFVAARDGSNGGEPSSSSPMIGEDVLARLRAAEEEAAKLRSQLAAVQGDKVRGRGRARQGGAAGNERPPACAQPSSASLRRARGMPADPSCPVRPTLAASARSPKRRTSSSPSPSASTARTSGRPYSSWVRPAARPSLPLRRRRTARLPKAAPFGRCWEGAPPTALRPPPLQPTRSAPRG
jgi:hypothetical protein